MNKEMWTPACYVCGHAPEEHREEHGECEIEGCDCICYEAPEPEEDEETPHEAP